MGQEPLRSTKQGKCSSHASDLPRVMTERGASGLG